MPVPTADNEQLQQDLESFAPGALAACELYGDEYKADDKEFTEEYQEVLRDLVRKIGANQGMWARRIEVQNKRRNRLYWQGIQRIAWDWKSNQWMIPYSGPVTPGQSGSGDAAERPPILDTTNIYQAYGRTCTAPILSNNPTVRFEAVDPKEPIDIRAASTAEKMRKVIERNNCMQDKRGDLARLLWTDGRVIAYTRYVINGQKFGFDEDGQPRGQEEISFFGVLEGRVSITANDLSEVPCIDISVEEEITSLQAAYPWIASKITTGSANMGEDEYDRISRLSVRMAERLQILAGDTYTHLSTHKRVWLRPSAFAHIADKDKRKWFLTNFADGCHAVWAGTAFAYARNESADDCLAVMRPLPGDGQDTPALGDVMISVQDRVNDLFDLQMEAYEYGLPFTWVNDEAVDVKALQEQRSQYGDHMPAEWPKEQALQNAFFTEQQATVPADMLKHIDDLRGSVAQFLCGSPPALYGGGMEDQKTASGYAMARDQALGTLAPIWQRVKTFYAKIMLQAVQCAARHREDDVVLNEGEQTIEISLQDLKGKIQCFPIVDENIPETWSQKRQAMMQFLTMTAGNPLILQQIVHPDNWSLLVKLIGIDELRMVGADSRNKALADIQELLDSAPVPTNQPVTQPGPMGPAPVMDPTTGQPRMIPGPSIPIDPVYDDPAAEFPEYKTWMNSPEARIAKQQKPDGWLNVRLRGNALFQALQQAQQQQMQQQAMMEMLKKAKPPQSANAPGQPPAGGPPASPNLPVQ